MAGMSEQWTEITPATEETQKICDMVKRDAETKWTKQSYEIFKAIEYRAQPESGTNFLIKWTVGSFTTPARDGCSRRCLNGNLLNSLQERFSSGIQSEPPPQLHHSRGKKQIRFY
uniref:Cystatin-A5-like n=1 Tax=Poecilia latipinna TaxID=48699 RepID=A0A3B3VD75_9TELE